MKCLVLILGVIGLMPASALAEPIYLRCIANEEFNRKDGRFLIATIDLDGGEIRTDDHYLGGTNTDVYTITRNDSGVIAGQRPSKAYSGSDGIKFDRVSGRVTLYADATDNAEKLWNERKQQIGGFEIPDGERLWMTTTYNCTLTNRYSLNGADLAKRWPVPECNARIPFNIDPQKDQIYLALAPGTVSSVSLQLVYADGSESAVRTYNPCDNAGEATCGVLVE